VKKMISTRSAVAALMGIVAACGGDERAGNTRGPEGNREPSGDAPLVAVTAVQLASFADEATARALADSLNAAGWTTSVRQGVARGQQVWRVQVAPTTSDDLAQRIAFALRADGQRPLVVRDSARLPGDVRLFAVNRGTHGMSAESRWARSPDRNALLIVEDPVGVEAEALPDGFAFADERGPVLIQGNGIWHVAPSPDWKRLAFGRAYVLNAHEGEAVAESTWKRVAREVKLPLDSVRRNGFMTSGMVPAYGFAQPVIVNVAEMPAGASSVSGQERTLPIAGGWRVGWTADGSILAIGGKPEMVQDDSPPTTWLGVDPASGSVRGPLQVGQVSPVEWTEGPTIDISVTIDLGVKRSLAIEGGTLESRNGWVYLNGQIVGPGLVVAATRTGKFIAALAPRPDAKEYEAKVEPVVYQATGRR
jgi:hypothetical protein